METERERERRKRQSERFEAESAHARAIEARGAALADTRWDRGQRDLTVDERDALSHSSRWGSDGRPIERIGRGWTYRWRSIEAPALYRTKREAVDAWETLLAIYRRISGLRARECALAEQRESAARGDIEEG